MKLSRHEIARAALGLLNDKGLDGLTMRVVAAALGVQAPTLYWHVKNKQDLLDAMADLMFDEASADLEAPRHGEAWDDWLVGCTSVLRRSMLRYRDGARVYAGSHTAHPAIFRTLELTLRTMQAGGIPVRLAARSFPALLHYTVGFTIEQQARTGIAYGPDNPYAADDFGIRFDPQLYPLTAETLDAIYQADSDAAFEHGLRLILTGIREAARSRAAEVSDG